MNALVRRTCGTLLACLALGGCGGATIEDGFESQLRPVGDCPEQWLQATDEGERVHLVFRATDEPVQALRAGEAERRYDLAEAGPGTLFVEEGRRLAQGFCDGSGNPSVTRRFHGTDGAVRLTLQGQTLRLSAEALTLAEEAGSARVTVPSLDLSWALP